MASVKSVDMNRAMTSESYAAQLIRSKDITAAQRGQIVAHWGSDKVAFWESVDSTEYQIDETDYNNARAKGKDATAESVGYDGSKNHGAWVDVGTSTVGAAGGRYAGTKVAGYLGKKAGEKGAAEAGKNSFAKNASDILTVILASVEVALYLIRKPNKEQYEAIMKLFESEYPQGLSSLEQAQTSMQEATEETTDLTDDAQEANEEANDTIENDKTKMDFYKAQYEALIMKANAAANGGEPLTADEKALLLKLAPLLAEIVGDIGDTNEEASDELTELYDQIGDYQDTYDTGAETIAEVQGVTDYGEGFDESTRTMCYVEATAQGINGASALIAAAKLYAKAGLTFGTALVFAAIGTVAAGFSLGKFLPEQLKMASDIGDVIDKRKEVQDFEDATTEVYDEELDNYAGQFDIVDEMTVDMPEDLDVPDEGEAAAVTGGNGSTETGDTEGSGNPFADAVAGVGDENDNNGGAATRAGGTGNDDDNNGSGTTLPPEKDPAYVSKMGYGKDWTEVTEGNVKRNSDDEIVTKDGKVLLTSTYCNAITKATGAKEGEAFSKSDIPKILEELLGDPFTAEMIKKVRKGKTLDSEYAAKILKTKSQEDTGKTTTVDNSKQATALAKQVIDFYYPIFEKAAEKGWVKG